MNIYTAAVEADATDPTVTHETDRWVRQDEDGNWYYEDNDRHPDAMPAEKPTEEDHRRAKLDSRLIRAKDAWFDLNCYSCGMRQSRPIHGHCFE